MKEEQDDSNYISMTEEELSELITTAQFQFGNFIFSRQRFDIKLGRLGDAEKAEQAMSNISEQDIDDFYDYVDKALKEADSVDNELNEILGSSNIKTNSNDIKYI